MQVTKPTFDTYKDTHRKDGRTSPLHLLSHAGGRSGGSRDIGGVAACFMELIQKDMEHHSAALRLACCAFQVCCWTSTVFTSLLSHISLSILYIHFSIWCTFYALSVILKQRIKMVSCC